MTKLKRKAQRLTWEHDARLENVLAHATAVLGTRQRARQWFTTPKIALGGASPLDFSKTDPGLREVDHLLGRIEHGVLS